MTIHTLKEITLDAARYRGLRELLDSGVGYLVSGDMSVLSKGAAMDAYIDGVLALDD